MNRSKTDRLAMLLVECAFALLALGLILLVARTALPAVGWIIGLVTVPLGLGALWMRGRNRLTRRTTLVLAPS